MSNGHSLCCAVLCCAVLCCAVLCCAVLCSAVLCCAVLCCGVVWWLQIQRVEAEQHLLAKFLLQLDRTAAVWRQVGRLVH